VYQKNLFSSTFSATFTNVRADRIYYIIYDTQTPPHSGSDGTRGPRQNHAP